MAARRTGTACLPVLLAGALHLPTMHMTDRIVFGPPPRLKRHLVDVVNLTRHCVECQGGITYGQRYAYVGGTFVCDPCADDIEAGRRE